MKYTTKQREDAAVKACEKWLETKWGKHYFSMTVHLPADDAEELRLMLQQSIRQAMSHRPKDLITTDEVNRQFCNLLDGGKLFVLENRYEMCKRIDEQNAHRAAIVEQERSTLAEEIADAEAATAFEQAIADRAAEDAANKKIPIKDLRRAALFGSDRIKGHLTTTPIPPSVKIFSRSPKQ